MWFGDYKNQKNNDSIQRVPASPRIIFYLCYKSFSHGVTCILYSDLSVENSNKSTYHLTLFIKCTK